MTDIDQALGRGEVERLVHLIDDTDELAREMARSKLKGEELTS